MRILKNNAAFSLVDSPKPSNLSYLWNFGSLLGFCLIIQIVTGVTLAMHYNPSVLEIFNSVEFIVRDLNNGLLIHYLYVSTFSVFVFLIYLHVNNISLFINPPKPHHFCSCKIESSLGGFNLEYILNLDSFYNFIQYIFPYMYNMNNAVYDVIQGVSPYIFHISILLDRIMYGPRQYPVGVSLDLSHTSEENPSDEFMPWLILPHLPLQFNAYILLYKIWLNTAHSGLGNLLILGLFVWLLRSVGFLSARTNLGFITNGLSHSYFIYILIVFVLFIPGVLGYEPDTAITINNPFLAYTILTNILFLLANWLFDYHSARYRLNDIRFFNSTIVTRLFLGILYLLNITSGVFATNGTWYLFSNYNTALAAIFTTLGAIIFPMLWFLFGFNNRLGINLVFNSLWRAVLELASFNCVAFCTYIYWNFWCTHVTSHTYLIALIVFTFILVFVGYVTIWLESNVGRGRSLGYGISYWLTFTCIAMSTNSIYALITEHISVLYLGIIICVITALLTILFYPDIYRGGVLMTRSNLAHVLLSNSDTLNNGIYFSIFAILQHLALFYLVFLCFVLYTGLLFTYIYNWLNS